MDYLLLALAFLATLFAIRGQTWDRTASGLKKLTPSGWGTIIVAFLFLIFSFVNSYKKNQESIELKKQISQTPRIIFSAWINSGRGEPWKAPRKIPGGSIVEFHGFDQDLELWRGTSHLIPVRRSDNGPVRVPLVSMTGSPDGILYEWSIAPTKPQGFYGSVYVYSTQGIETGIVSEAN